MYFGVCMEVVEHAHLSLLGLFALFMFPDIIRWKLPYVQDLRGSLKRLMEPSARMKWRRLSPGWLFLREVEV